MSCDGNDCHPKSGITGTATLSSTTSFLLSSASFSQVAYGKGPDTKLDEIL